MVNGKPSSWWMLARWAKVTRNTETRKVREGEYPITRKLHVFKPVHE